MKQAMKRFGAMLLTMAMLLSLAVTGVSAEGAESTTTPTVKIQFNGLENDDTLKAYRVIKYNDTLNDFENGEAKAGTTDFLAYLNTKNEAATGEAKKANGIAYLASVDSDSTQLRELLHGFLTKGTLTADAAKQASTEGKLENVAPGYYILQVESNTKIYNTMLLFVGYNEGKLVVQMGGDELSETAAGYTATLKSEKAPTVKKFVFDDRGVTDRETEIKNVANWKSAAASEVGKVVDFAIKVELPTYHDDADVTLTLNDTLQNMEYTSDVPSIEAGVKVYYKDGDNGYVAVDDGVERVTAGEYNTEDGTQSLTIGLDYAALKKIPNQKEFYVHYKAILRENAVAANEHKGTNRVTLGYKVKTSAGEYTGNPKADEVNVYTYNFKLVKQYDNGKGAAGAPAKFSVYTDAGLATAMKFTAVNGTDDSVAYYYPDVNGAVEQIPADFEIRGLDVSTLYYVKEVETPAGYYAPSSYFTLQLSGDEKAATTVLNGELKYDNPNDYSAPSSFVANDKAKDQALVKNGKTTAGDANQYGAINDPNKYQYDVTLNNSSTPVLPSTGGMGTTLFTVGGVALLALAAAMLILRRRKN